MLRNTLLVALVALCLPAQSPKLLLQRPALTQTLIVFSYAGDLWTVPRAGGEAARLTNGMGVESNPVVVAGRNAGGVFG